MANFIVTWVIVSLIGEKILVNSKWQIALYMMYNYVWSNIFVKNQDNLYVISKHFENTVTSMCLLGFLFIVSPIMSTNTDTQFTHYSSYSIVQHQCSSDIQSRPSRYFDDRLIRVPSILPHQGRNSIQPLTVIFALTATTL